MNNRIKIPDRYKYGAILAYVLLNIVLVILLITIWNKLTLNSSISIGNSLYFLIILIAILAAAIFIFFLAFAGSVLPGQDISKSETVVETNNASKENKPGTFTAPFEVDIDILADKVIPKIDPRETPANYSERILINLAKEFEFTQGIFYLKNPATDTFEPLSTYAYASPNPPGTFVTGEGLNGQVAKDKKILYMNNLPENYINVVSGLGKGKACHLIIIPLLLNKETFGILELTSFRLFTEEFLWTIRNIAKIISNVMVTKIKAKGATG